MNQTIVLKSNPGMRFVWVLLVLVLIAFGIVPMMALDQNASLIPIQWVREAPDRWKLLFYAWIIITSPLALGMLYHSLCQRITMSATGISKNIMGRNIPYADIIRVGEATISRRLRNRGDDDRLTSRHILLLDKKGKTMRINWMMYTLGSEIPGLLEKITGIHPEALVVGAGGTLRFKKIESCPSCRANQEDSNGITCSSCGLVLGPRSTGAPEFSSEDAVRAGEIIAALNEVIRRSDRIPAGQKENKALVALGTLLCLAGTGLCLASYYTPAHTTPILPYHGGFIAAACCIIGIWLLRHHGKLFFLILQTSMAAIFILKPFLAPYLAMIDQTAPFPLTSGFHIPYFIAGVPLLAHVVLRFIKMRSVPSL